MLIQTNPPPGADVHVKPQTQNRHLHLSGRIYQKLLIEDDIRNCLALVDSKLVRTFCAGPSHSNISTRLSVLPKPLGPQRSVMNVCTRFYLNAEAFLQRSHSSSARCSAIGWRGGRENNVKRSVFYLNRD